MKRKKDNSQYSSILFVIFLITSIVFTTYVLSSLNLVGIPLILLVTLVSLWFSLFGTIVISIYYYGKLQWGENSTYPTTEYFLYILLLTLIVLISVGTNLIPNSKIIGARKNLFRSLLYGLIGSTVSTIPFVILVWIVLLFHR